jgi:aspartokinase
MSYEYQPDVAKYGGSSAAHLRTVWEQDQHPDNRAGILVLSGPGVDREERFTERLTDTFLNGGGLEAARTRFAAVMQEIDPANENAGIQEVFDNMAQDYESWQRSGHALEALPEFWSAKFYAAYSGREFVDAAEVVLLDEAGDIDLERSTQAIRDRFQPGRQYVVPGFYGSGPDGRIRTIGRGGSDTTGALLAVALRSQYYFNYTDQDGLFTCPPDIAANGIVRDKISYREMRELNLGGCNAISADAIKYLGGSGVDTVICNTFGEAGNRGTVVTEFTNWGEWGDRPVASITGRDDLLGIWLKYPGLNEQVGGTNAVFDALRDRGIPYHYITNATDDIAVLTADKWQEGLAEISRDIQRSSGADVALRRYGAIHIVGEGLAEGRIVRRLIHGEVTLALAKAGIEDYGDVNNGYSPSLTTFVNPESLHREAEHNSLRIAHDAARQLLQERGCW